MAEQKSSGASQAPKKDLKTVKAEQKARRKADKIEAKERKKAAKANKRGFFKQIADVFKMTRKFDPSIVWWMIGAFVAALVIGLVIGLVTGSPVLWTLMFIPLGLLAAIIIMNKKAEKAAFAQIDGRPGAAGAALSQLGRGWVVEDEPIAVNPRTQETVFRATGKAGGGLVADGGYNRAKRIADKQSKQLQRFLPNVESRSPPLPRLTGGREQQALPCHRRAADGWLKANPSRSPHALKKLCFVRQGKPVWYW